MEVTFINDLEAIIINTRKILNTAKEDTLTRISNVEKIGIHDVLLRYRAPLKMNHKNIHNETLSYNKNLIQQWMNETKPATIENVELNFQDLMISE